MVILMSFCFGCLRCFTFSNLFRLSGWAVPEKIKCDIHIESSWNIFFYFYIYYTYYIYILFSVDRSQDTSICLPLLAPIFVT